MKNIIKLKLLYLSDIFFKYTDEKHALSTSQLIDKMGELGIEVTRQALKKDIELLIEYGYDIRIERKSTNEYALVNREFEIPELKLMLDAVETSHFLTSDKTKLLTSKVEGLASIEQAKYLNSCPVTSVKNTNERIFINIDRLYKAIFYNHKVSFNYFTYTIEKKKVKKRNGETYTVSPYDLLYKNDNYYLIAHHPRYDSVTVFRIDKITNIKVLKDEPARPRPSGYNIEEYCNKIFEMYKGELKHVELKFDISLLDVVFDKFGEDIHIYKSGENHFIVKVSVEVSPTFFSWLFIFGNQAEILAPLEVKDGFINRIRSYPFIND